MGTLNDCLIEMDRLYQADPMAAVRSQGFIKTLHKHLAVDIRARLQVSAVKAGVQVKEEAKLFGSHKTKDVDVAVIDPNNGPLLITGVRSQMSSVGKNVLNYYQDIVGECISLQDRFPMSVIGYVYLHPLSVKKKPNGLESLDHARYARMYENISGRDGRDYKNIRGVYDHFAYLVVDFTQSPPLLRDDIVTAAVPKLDMSLATFADRMVDTFKARNIWLDVFK